MSCSGLHCAGCSGGMAVPPVVFACAYGVVWVAEHLVEIVAASAVCGVLAVAAVVALMRWCDRRQARAAASRTIWTAREVPAVRLGQLPGAGRRELNPPAAGEVHQHWHLHIGADAAPQEVAAIMRHVREGRTLE